MELPTPFPIAEVRNMFISAITDPITNLPLIAAEYIFNYHLPNTEGKPDFRAVIDAGEAKFEDFEMSGGIDNATFKEEYNIFVEIAVGNEMDGAKIFKDFDKIKMFFLANLTNTRYNWVDEDGADQSSYIEAVYLGRIPDPARMTEESDVLLHAFSIAITNSN